MNTFEPKKIIETINNSIDQWNNVYGFFKKTYDTAFEKTSTSMLDLLKGSIEFHNNVVSFNEELMKKGLETFKKGMENISQNFEN